jgi:hypothetical protein
MGIFPRILGFLKVWSCAIFSLFKRKGISHHWHWIRRYQVFLNFFLTLNYFLLNFFNLWSCWVPWAYTARILLRLLQTLFVIIFIFSYKINSKHGIIDYFQWKFSFFFALLPIVIDHIQLFVVAFLKIKYNFFVNFCILLLITRIDHTWTCRRAFPDNTII